MKIVSLVPSLTELVIDLGLSEKLSGRTRFCIHPERVIRNIPVIGGTKNPQIEKIISLSPDIIIANREENRREDIEQLGKKAEIYLTDITSIEDALLTIHDLGNKLDADARASELIEKIHHELDQIPDEKPLSAAYLIWRMPWMTAGNNTYIHSVLQRWKLENIFYHQSRYPKTTLEEISVEEPDIILLSSEPFPFAEKHISEVQNVCNDSRILLVDGEWFSWYGSRMIPSFKKLNTFRRAIS
jgi:ABC-type Fe3+-hydroxamate transport system substrate-binding protein